MQDIDNAVVQLFVQNSLFNWLEPYKSPKQMSATGTAFFIDDQGHLLTNYHVISEASGIQLQMQLFGKQRFDVTVVGAYPERDIALLRMAPEGIAEIINQLGSVPFLSFGDSDQLERAQEIACLGYPLGQETLKITQGIVSGYQEFNSDFFLQVTAALNPGSSGGPALDSKNQVIGINTAIIPDAQNIGYLLPVNDIKHIVDSLRTNKLIRRPFLGCDVNYATADMVSFLNNPEPGGIYVSKVYEQSNFYDAGILAGDMLYAINEYELDLYGETTLSTASGKIPFTSLIQRFALGQDITIKLCRKGRMLDVKFPLVCHDLLPVRLVFPEFEPVDYEIIAGMVFMELTLNHVARFEERKPEFSCFRKRSHQYKSVLIVSHVFQNSLTQKARIINDADCIVLINNNPVQTLGQLRSAVRASSDYFSIQTTEGKCMVLSLAKIIADEEELAAQYFYTISPLVDVMRKHLA